MIKRKLESRPFIGAEVQKRKEKQVQKIGFTKLKILEYVFIRRCKILQGTALTGSTQPKNATDLLQFVSKLQIACQFHQVATSLLRSGLL